MEMWTENHERTQVNLIYEPVLLVGFQNGIQHQDSDGMAPEPAKDMKFGKSL